MMSALSGEAKCHQQAESNYGSNKRPLKESHICSLLLTAQWQENGASVREWSGSAAGSCRRNVNIRARSKRLATDFFFFFNLMSCSMQNGSVFCSSCETRVGSCLSACRHTHRGRNRKGMSGEMHHEWLRWCRSQIYGANILFQSLENTLTVACIHFETCTIHLWVFFVCVWFVFKYTTL